MLTAELVRARAKDGKLELVRWRGDQRKDALDLAEQYLAIARDMVGEPREALLASFASVPVRVRLDRVAAGLQKLVLDHSELEAETPVDPVVLRAEVFAEAARVRRDAATSEAFDRAAVLATVAERHALPAEEVERLLFADLKGAHRLLRAPTMRASELLDLYDLGQEQAVLLRAERVVIEVESRSPAQVRALFRKLKFLRLLYVVDRLPSGAYRITVDGPYSLFASVTKYGLSLAMLVPALRACDRWSLTAVVRWGKTRQHLVFETSGGLDTALSREADALAGLPDEVAELAEAFRKRHPAWDVRTNDDVLEVKGLGVLVPDLVFTHRETGSVVYFESLGFWSREAVWKRVDLVAAGLSQPVLFAVPARLRVSEDVLPAELPSALYVYKGTLRTTAVLERLEALAGGTPTRAP